MGQHVTIPQATVRYIQELSRTKTKERGFLFRLNANQELEIKKEFEGDSEFVTIPGSHRITVHTHPTVLYGDLKYHPPTQTDLKEALFSAIRGKLMWDVVISANGSWAYRPSKDLIEEAFAVQPDIVKVLGPPMVEGEKRRDINVNDDLFNLLDVLENNGGNNGARLAGVAAPEMKRLDLAEYISEMQNLLTDGMGFEVMYFPGDSAIRLPVIS